MNKDTVYGLAGLAIVAVLLYLGFRFISAVLGFIIDNPLLVAGAALVASVAAAVYFSKQR